MLPIKFEEIQDILSARMKLRKVTQALGVARRSAEQKVYLREVKAAPMYEQLGEKLGIPGRECELLLEEALNDPSDEQLDMFRRMFTIAKLTNPTVLVGYRTEVQRNQESYDALLARREAEEKRVQILEAELEKITESQPITDFRESFKAYMDVARQHFEERDNVIERFEPDYKILFEALNKNSRFIHALKNEETGLLCAVIDWDQVEKFHIEHINGIFRWIVNATKEVTNV